MDNQDEVQTEAIVSDSKVEVDNQSEDAVETSAYTPSGTVTTPCAWFGTSNASSL